MKTKEFVDFVNQRIAPKSGLRHITVAEDLHRWHEIGFLPTTQNTTDMICRLC